MNNLKKCFASKVSFQNQTIERVAEQFIIKTNLRENLINGDRRRKEIAKQSLVPRQNENYKKKIKMNEKTKKTIQMSKKILNEKLRDYEATFAQLATATEIEAVDEISAILEVLEKSENLKLDFEKNNEKIEELRQEKDSLAERLHMLSVSNAEATQNQTLSSYTEDEDLQIQRLNEIERKLQHYTQKLRKQNTIYSTCKLGIE